MEIPNSSLYNVPREYSQMSTDSTSNIKKAKIYTGIGDQGSTQLVNGEKVPKDHIRVMAYGDIDELNSQIGLFISMAKQKEFNFMSSQLGAQLIQFITQQQHLLFNLGSQFACNDLNLSKQLPKILELHISDLEKNIDIFNNGLPDLKSFVLPGGHLLSSQLHICRTVCRRTERHASILLQNQLITSVDFIYLNRLSDLFFTLARWVNHESNTSEFLWEK